MKLILLLSLFSSLAVAQVGICKPGAKCSVRDLTTTGGSALIKGYSCLYGQNAAWAWTSGTSVSSIGWTLGYTPASCNAANTVLSFSVNDAVVRSHATSGAFQSGTSCQSGGACFVSGAGAVGSPAYTFGTDPNTGLYSIGADQLGVSTAGTRSFNFNATAGVLEGATANAKLTLNDTSGAQLSYGASTYVIAGSASVQLNGLNSSAVVSGTGVSFTGVGGLTLNGVATPTSFVTTARAIQVDSNTGRKYWTPTVPSANSPPVDLGGKPHPVLQARMYMLDVGVESTATPLFKPAPQVAASAVTFAVVDGAAASVGTMGTAPHLTDARVANTTATAAPGAGSTSTGISSAMYARRDHGPRWSALVAVSSKTSARVVAGLTTALVANSDAWGAQNFVAFRSSSAAGDANWMACSSDGATQSCTDTTISVDAPNMQTLVIDCREAAACTFWIDGVARVRKTTNLPTLTTRMGNFYVLESLSAAVRSLSVGVSAVELR